MPYPTVIPMLAYEDGAAALDWLVRAFGFTERERWTDDDGRLTHGELALGEGIVMLASPTPKYQSPKRHAETCDAARAWQNDVPYVIDGVLVHVPDVDAHHERAQREGATILSPPEDTDVGRHYRVADLEGHRWMFAEL